MPITGIPTTPGDDIITVTPPGGYSVNGLTGTDTLIVDYSSLMTNVRYWYDGWGHLGDGFHSSVAFTNFEHFHFIGGSGADFLVGGSGADTLIGNAGDDLLQGGTGADVIIGGAGNDIWNADLSSVHSGVTVTLANGTTNVVGTGGTVKGIEALQIRTGGGNDVINTKAMSGNDSIQTGAGDDKVVVGGGHDAANGGGGTDRLVVDWSHISNPNHGIMYSYDGWHHLRSNSGDQVDYTGFEIFNFTGGAGNDELRGGNLADTLVGNGGNDTLRGYQGTDKVLGGAGTDTWEVHTQDLAGDVIIDLQTQSSNAGHTLAKIEQLIYRGGDAHDFITALDGRYNDDVETGNGNDSFASFRGMDRANGGGGTDTLIMDWSGISDAVAGITYSYDGWHHYRSASGDSMDMTGFEIFDLTGGAGGDDLRGGNLNDTLRGNAGNDTLRGYMGDDVIDGGAGIDTWFGDTSDQPFALVFRAKASQTKSQGGSLGLDIRNIEAVNLSTGAANDKVVMKGYKLRDVFYGNEGNDTFNGGEGHDTFHGGAGNDLAVISWAKATNAIHSWYDGWLHYTDDSGMRQIDMTAVERFAITGGSGDDSLTGGAFKDKLKGNAGDDVLNGGAGADVINGGAGNDTLVKDDSGVVTNTTVIAKASGNGTFVGSGAKFYSIENFNITTGVGNDIINLSAQSGNDTVASGEGDDLINVGRGDYARVNGGGGNDLLVADLSDFDSGTFQQYDGWYHYRSNTTGQELVFTGIEQLKLTGTMYSDHLQGLAGNDTLKGGAGDDILQGNGGNDYLTGNSGNDQFLFNSNSANIGVDRITDMSAGDFLRITALGGDAIGSVANGDGTGVGRGAIEISSSGGVTTVHVGLDTTAGSDLDVELNGTFTAADFISDYQDLFML